MKRTFNSKKKKESTFTVTCATSTYSYFTGSLRKRVTLFKRVIIVQKRSTCSIITTTNNKMSYMKYL